MSEKKTNSSKLGEMLTIEKLLSFNQLEDALQSQKEFKQVDVPARLGEVLVESRVCSATIVSEALHRQRDRQLKSNTLGQILLELGFVTRKQLEQVMQTHLDILAPFGEILVDQGICDQAQINKHSGFNSYEGFRQYDVRCHPFLTLLM